MKNKLITFIKTTSDQQAPSINDGIDVFLDFEFITESDDPYQGDFETPLLIALIIKGKYSLATELINSIPPNLIYHINSTDSGDKTPLYHAIIKEKGALVKLIATKGGDTTIVPYHTESQFEDDPYNNFKVAAGISVKDIINDPDLEGALNTIGNSDVTWFLGELLQ